MVVSKESPTGVSYSKIIIMIGKGFFNYQPSGKSNNETLIDMGLNYISNAKNSKMTLQV